VVNQNYENLQAKNVLYEDLERSHSALENEYCGLESEHVELCLELARWKANYRELAIVISDLEELQLQLLYSSSPSFSIHLVTFHKVDLYSRTTYLLGHPYTPAPPATRSAARL